MVLCAGAEAETVTVGSPLTAEFPSHTGSSATGTFANIGLPEPGANAASPIAGTVVRWRVKGAFLGGPFMLQVLRPAGGISYSSVATSAPETPSGEATQVFATDLPIAAGDVIGIETSHPSDQIGAAAGAAGVNGFNWIPPLVDGGAAAPAHTFEFPDELGFNADVESLQPVVAPAPAPTSTLPAPVAPPPATCTVPKLKGKSLKASKKKITTADCKVGKVTKKKGVTTKTGKVVSQSPKVGASKAAGSKVNVTFG
jgi:PASTA domain